MSPRVLGEAPSDLDARGERRRPRWCGETDEPDELAGVSVTSTAHRPKPLFQPCADPLDHLVALLRGQRRREVLHHVGIGVQRRVGRLVVVAPLAQQQAVGCADVGSPGFTRRPSSRARQHGVGRHVGDHLDAVGTVEHERQAVDRLLVAPHQREQPRVVEAGRQRDRQLVRAGDHVEVLLHARVVDAAEHSGEVGRVDEPDGDRLAVRELVIGLDLERVGERVPVVEQGATAPLIGALALVARPRPLP